MQIPRKMSAQNVMASISRTLGTSRQQHHHHHHHHHHQQQQQQQQEQHQAHQQLVGVGSNDCSKPIPVAPNEVKFAGDESKERLYLPKHKQKLVRVLTVVAYIISVSLAAIVLSLYYMYIWKPTDNAYYYYQVKSKPNATSGLLAGNASHATSTVKTLCSEIGQAVANEPIDRILQEGTSLERTTPLAPTTETSSDSSSPSAPSQPTRSLYKTLTTPANRRTDFQDYQSSTELPEQLLVPAEARRAEDYQDARIMSADDLLDD